MLKNIAVAFIAVVLLSGCSSRSNKGCSSLVDSQHMKEFTQVVGDKVFFGLDESSLSAKSQSVLSSQASWLNEHKSYSVTVEGHCDERGTREYNIALGERRAESVKKFLVKNGVDVSRIETISYGKERPEVMGNGDETFAKNRRAVTVIK